jgi:hypothetical protein
MKVMVFGKATRDTEAGVPATPAEMEAMGKYFEALMAAGIIKEPVFGGLKPSRFGKRVRYSSKKCTVIDGPFTETKEVIAGYSIWDVSSIEEAIEWVKKGPIAEGGEVEIRPIYSAEDLASWDDGSAHSG